jgi:hypothetical protein
MIAYFRSIKYDGEIMSQAEAFMSEPSGCRATRLFVMPAQAGNPGLAEAELMPASAGMTRGSVSIATL